MGDAQRGIDAQAFYAAALGRTRKLLCSSVAAQFSDNDGALPPMRYLLHVADISPTNRTIWIATGKFIKSVALSVADDVPYFPMGLSGVVAIEINVLKGHNDQIAAIMTGGNGILYVTEVSRPG